MMKTIVGHWFSGIPSASLAVWLLLFLCHSAQAASATDCTLYVGPNGSDSNAGTSANAPKTIGGGASASRPGDVVCFLAGTYNLSQAFYPKGGTSSAWTTYKNYGDGDVNLVWTGGGNASDLNMIHFYSGSAWGGPSYIEIRGLNLDGRNQAKFGIFCQNAHHLRYVGNRVTNQGEGGIGSKNCDYQTADSNRIDHNGYNGGWSSGVSLNSNHWYDTAPGFHTFVVNNIVSGTYDSSSNHTDGNGIIMDLSTGSYDPNTANSPPVLIANNVVYENGGRCIQGFVVTNMWVVNNTCYKNALDTSSNDFGELNSNSAKNGYFINNVAYSWNNRQPLQQMGSSSGNVYYRNLYFGGNPNFNYSDSPQLIKADPLFLNPPALNPTAGGQYATALPTSQLGISLHLQAGSPGIDRGIDPTSVPGASAQIIAGLRQYVFKDINGVSRPQGGGFDIGAYELASAGASSPCDVNNDGSTNVVDVQQAITEVLELAPCRCDINKDGQCTVIDIQRIVNGALGSACVSP